MAKSDMIVLVAACFVYAAVFASASSPSSGTVVSRMGELTPFQIATALRGVVAENGGCKINACFAVQASRFVLLTDYETQKRIVSVVSRVVLADPGAQVAAVQYAAANSAISPLTSNVSQIIQGLNAARRSLENESFIGGAILYCADQVRNSPDDVNKMVLFGDGQNTLGFEPFPRAEVFRELGGEVFVFAIGRNVDLEALKQILDGNDSNLITIEDGEQNRNKFLINGVVQLVSGLCGISDEVLNASLE